MQGEHRDRALDGQLELCVLDRADRVLKARVVELHHVRPLAAAGGEPAREVDVDDVKAARAEPEIERLHVDDDLIAHLGGADERDIGDRRARAPLELDDEILLARVGGSGLCDRRSAELQHSSVGAAGAALWTLTSTSHSHSG